MKKEITIKKIFITFLLLTLCQQSICQNLTGKWTGVFKNKNVKSAYKGDVIVYLKLMPDSSYIGYIEAGNNHTRFDYFVVRADNETHKMEFYNYKIYYNFNALYHNQSHDISFKKNKIEGKLYCANTNYQSEQNWVLSLKKEDDIIPEDIKNKLDAFSKPTFEIVSVSYNCKNDESIQNKDDVKKNDDGIGELKVVIKNISTIDLQMSVGAGAENIRGVLFYDFVYKSDRGGSTITPLTTYKSGEEKSILFKVFKANDVKDSLRFQITVRESLTGTSLAIKRNFKCESLQYFDFKNIIAIDYNSTRLKAVSYYFKNQDVKIIEGQKILDSLVQSGDYKAKVWKGILTYMGWGGYFTDEGAGRALVANEINKIKNNANTGDLESIYFLFHAYDMGLLDNEAASKYSTKLLDLAVANKFDIAIFEVGYRMHKMTSGFRMGALLNTKLSLNSSINEEEEIDLLVQSYKNGFRKSGYLIKQIYEANYKVAGKTIYVENLIVRRPDSLLMDRIAIKIANWNKFLSEEKDLDYLTNQTINELFNTSSIDIQNKNVAQLEILSKQGDMETKRALYLWYSKRDLNKSYVILNELADKGDREAMFILGVNNISISNKQTELGSDDSWIQRAANKNHPMAMLYCSQKFIEKVILSPDEFNQTHYWLNQLELNKYQINNGKQYEDDVKIITTLPSISQDQPKKQPDKVVLQFWSDWDNIDPTPIVRDVQTSNIYDNNGNIVSYGKSYKEYDYDTPLIMGMIRSVVKFGITRLAQMEDAQRDVSEFKIINSSNDFDSYACSVTRELQTNIYLKKGQVVFLHSDGEISFKTGNAELVKCGLGGTFIATESGNISFIVNSKPKGYTRTSFLLNVIK